MARVKPLPDLFDLERKVRRTKPAPPAQAYPVLLPEDVVIGIDLSLTSTGVAAVHPGGLWHSTIEPKNTGMPRLQRIRDEIVELCHNRALVMIEEPSVRSNGAGHAAIIGNWFVVVLALIESGRTVYQVNPMTLHKFVAGTGAAKKDDMKLAVFKRWGSECRTSDEADAIGLAIMGAMLGGIRPATLAQRESLNKARRVL